MKSSSICLFASAFLLSLSGSHAFSIPPSAPRSLERDTVVGKREAATARAFREEKPKQKSFLLEEFTIYNGELVQPYDLLGVSRTAERLEIRKAYIELSKLYHPDAVRHRDVLPVGCTCFDDVREQWERIKLSYEILSDRKTRMKYDRHESIAKALEDPSAAMKQAAGEAVRMGAENLGKGMFEFSNFAFQQMKKKMEK